MKIKNLIEKLKIRIIEAESFDKIREAASKGYLPLESLRDSDSYNISAREKMLILVENKRYDLVTDKLLEWASFSGWCEFWSEVIKKKIFIPTDLKSKMLVYFKKEMTETVKYYKDISYSLYKTIFRDKQVAEAIVDVLKNLDVDSFGKLKKDIFPRSLLNKVYKERRKLLSTSEGRQILRVRQRNKTFKNLLFEAIMENNYDTYERSRVKVNDLSRDDFYTLVPYWLKCDVLILKEMMKSPYFKELSDEIKNNVIIRCVNDEDTLTAALRIIQEYDINFDWQIIKHVRNAVACRKLLGIYLKKCCLQKLVDEEIDVEWTELNSFLNTLFISDPQIMHYYYAALVIFEPKFVEITDEEEKYFYDYLLDKEISLNPPEHLLKLYELMLEIFAAGIPQDRYQEVLQKVAEILPAL